jgi:hypothetical protein
MFLSPSILTSLAKVPLGAGACCPASVAVTDTQHAELVEKIQHWDGPTVEAYVEFVS